MKNQNTQSPGENTDNESKIVKIVVPCFGEEVAPRFEAARRFRVWEIGAGTITHYQEIAVEEPGALIRIRMLRNMITNVLICNGIERQTSSMLQAEGFTVVEGVVGSGADVLYGYLAGKLRPKQLSNDAGSKRIQPHTADLVQWTEELFEKLGWSVDKVSQDAPFPIDLVAEKECPKCRKSIRIAVCCGAHAYRVENEIREFSRVTISGYNSRVYVHQPMTEVMESCKDYNIELLDPGVYAASTSGFLRYSDIPPITGSVNGHEKINLHKEMQD